MARANGRLWYGENKDSVCAAFYEKQSGKIGPDPLREDANVEKVWEKLHASKKPVGLVLMDQSMVAGIGNIYRAEILFKASTSAMPDAVGVSSTQKAKQLQSMRQCL